MLATYVASTPAAVLRWAAEKWRPEDYDDGLSVGSADRWAVKASTGNGGNHRCGYDISYRYVITTLFILIEGRDVWFIDCGNYREIIAELPPHTEFVIQKYVDSPLLYMGSKKFHFRCYSAIRADCSPLLYEKGFILTAGLDYDIHSTDPMTHITNLSVNKKMENHPGQIPTFISQEYPEVTIEIN